MYNILYPKKGGVNRFDKKEIFEKGIPAASIHC